MSLYINYDKNKIHILIYLILFNYFVIENDGASYIVCKLYFNQIKMNKLKKNLTVAVTSLALCLTLVPVAFAGNDLSSTVPAIISVTGEGKATVAADKAVISVTIESVENTARNARQKNNQVYSDLKTAMQSMGVEVKDINIDYNSGFPNYEYGENNVRKLTNYTSTYTVSIKVKDVSKVEALTDRLTDFDTVNFQNVSYLLDNNESATDQAREKAVDNALSKAQKLAKLYHVTLGNVTSVNESSYVSTPYSGMMGGSGSTNSVEVTTSLTVNYEISK